MRKKRLTIRARLLWLLLGLVVPLVLAGFFNLWSFWLETRAGLDESLERQAQLAASAFEQQILAHRQTLETVALLARGGLGTEITLRQYLDSVLKTRPEWVDIQILGREGNVLLAQSKDVAKRPAHSVEDVRSESARHNAFVVLAEQSEDKKLHYFSLSQPIGDGNFVAARVDVTSANAVFDGLVLPEDNIIAVFDRNNRLVYRNRDLPEQTSIEVIETPLFSALNEKREGVIEIESPYDRIERVYGLATVRTGNYVVAVGVPSSRLYEPALRQFARQAFFGLLIASLAVIAAFGFARTIVTPLHQLTETARAFGEGESSARADVTVGGAIGELGSTFNTMADQIADREERLKELDRLKSEFVSSVSHELRTPLTTIKTLTRVLESDKISGSERTEYLQTISEECDRQIEFVRNLLDLSRLESGAYPIIIAEVHVVELLSELVGATELAAKSRNLTLAFCQPNTCLPKAFADPSVLRQAISSIVENAMKYTPENGTVTVSVREDNRRIAIEIADNGCGIAKRDIPFIFDKFVRGRPISASSGDPAIAAVNETSGVGLGLYLVRNLLQRMGGNVSVSSPVKETKVGAVFTVSLPTAPVVPAERHRRSSD